MTLDHMKPGQTGTVASLDADGVLLAGLTEAGLVPGAVVEVMARGVFGGTPLSIRVGRAIVALRKTEAALVVLA